jgi:hypothetical protein
MDLVVGDKRFSGTEFHGGNLTHSTLSNDYRNAYQSMVPANFNQAVNGLNTLQYRACNSEIKSDISSRVRSSSKGKQILIPKSKLNKKFK